MTLEADEVAPPDAVTIDLTALEPAQSPAVDLYCRFFSKLLPYARLLTAEESSAHQLVREVFVRLDEDDAHTRATSFAELLSALLRVARSRGRGPGRPRHASFDARQARLESLDTSEQLLDAICELSARQRECVVLRHFASMRDKEIAQTASVSVTAVGSHVQRAMARLVGVVGPEAADRQLLADMLERVLAARAGAPIPNADVAALERDIAAHRAAISRQRAAMKAGFVIAVLLIVAAFARGTAGKPKHVRVVHPPSTVFPHTMTSVPHVQLRSDIAPAPSVHGSPSGAVVSLPGVMPPSPVGRSAHAGATPSSFSHTTTTIASTDSPPTSPRESQFYFVLEQIAPSYYYGAGSVPPGQTVEVDWPKGPTRFTNTSASAQVFGLYFASLGAQDQIIAVCSGCGSVTRAISDAVTPSTGNGFDAAVENDSSSSGGFVFTGSLPPRKKTGPWHVTITSPFGTTTLDQSDFFVTGAWGARLDFPNAPIGTQFTVEVSTDEPNTTPYYFPLVRNS